MSWEVIYILGLIAKNLYLITYHCTSKLPIRYNLAKLWAEHCVVFLFNSVAFHDLKCF